MAMTWHPSTFYTKYSSPGFTGYTYTGVTSTSLANIQNFTLKSGKKGGRLTGVIDARGHQPLPS